MASREYIRGAGQMRNRLRKPLDVDAPEALESCRRVDLLSAPPAPPAEDGALGGIWLALLIVSLVCGSFVGVCAAVDDVAVAAAALSPLSVPFSISGAELCLL